jgi:hypothetical protein
MPVEIDYFEIAALNLTDGDVLVIRTPRELSLEELVHWHQVWKSLLPVGVRIIAVPPGTDLTVLTKAEIDAKAV